MWKFNKKTIKIKIRNLKNNKINKFNKESIKSNLN